MASNDAMKHACVEETDVTIFSNIVNLNYEFQDFFAYNVCWLKHTKLKLELQQMY